MYSNIRKKIILYLDEMYKIPNEEISDLDKYFNKTKDINLLQKFLYEAIAIVENRTFWTELYIGGTVVISIGVLTIYATIMAPVVEHMSVGDTFSYVLPIIIVLLLLGSMLPVLIGFRHNRIRIANVLIKEAIQRRLNNLEKELEMESKK